MDREEKKRHVITAINQEAGPQNTHAQRQKDTRTQRDRGTWRQKEKAGVLLLHKVLATHRLRWTIILAQEIKVSLGNTVRPHLLKKKGSYVMAHTFNPSEGRCR